MKRLICLLLVVGCLSFILFNCEKDSPTKPKNQPPIIAIITANPSDLDWGATSQLVVIAVDPEEQILAYSWTSTGGVFNTPTTNDTVTWQAPDSSGSFVCTVTVTDEENTVSKNITITVTENPVLSIDQDSLVFGATTETLNFNITNTGTGLLIWSINTTTDDGGNWLSVSPSQGTTTTETDQITVTVDRTGFSSGTYSGQITVTSNRGDATVNVQAEKEKTVTGRWSQTFVLSGTTFPGYYNLVQNGTQLTGDFVFSDGSGYTTLHSSSSINGQNIKIVWYLDIYKLSFIGTVSDDFNSMSGDMYLNDTIWAGTWTAQRVSALSKVLISTSNDNLLAETFINILSSLK